MLLLMASLVHSDSYPQPSLQKLVYTISLTCLSVIFFLFPNVLPLCKVFTVLLSMIITSYALLNIFYLLRIFIFFSCLFFQHSKLNVQFTFPNTLKPHNFLLVARIICIATYCDWTTTAIT